MRLTIYMWLERMNDIFNKKISRQINSLVYNKSPTDYEKGSSWTEFGETQFR